MLKKYFIPHSENGYKPHIFRETSIIVFLIIIVSIFAYSTLFPLLNEQGNLPASIYASVIVDSTNHDRASEGDLPKLTVNPLLVEAAKEKANDMAEKGYFAHNSPDGLTPWYWIKKAGYPYLYAGENLAVDFTDSDDVEKAWMNSPLHRANILNQHYTEIGIATAKGKYDGKETIFVVEMFGSERPGSALATSESSPTQPTLNEPIKETPATETAETSSVGATPKTEETSTPASAAVTEKEVSSVNSIVVALQRVEGDSVSPVIATPVPEVRVMSAEYSTFYERFLLNPSRALKNTYLLLAVLIFISLILFVFIEWRIQHPKNILYAILLLIIIASLFSINWLLTGGNLIII